MVLVGGSGGGGGDGDHGCGGCDRKIGKKHSSDRGNSIAKHPKPMTLYVQNFYLLLLKGSSVDFTYRDYLCFH